MIKGEIWWADLPVPVGSVPGKRRPVLIVQNDFVTRSAISTVIVVALTTNLSLARAPGNLMIEKHDSNLKKPCVVNISQVVTIDKSWLTENVGMLRKDLRERVDQSLRFIYDL